MTTSGGPYGPGETAVIYRLCQIFKTNPGLHYHSITIHENGRVEVAAVGEHGVLMQWARALPDHRRTAGLATTAYGSTEAVVLTDGPVTVTVRPPFGGVPA